ncbi:MAG: hypothetical protein ACK5NY_02095 [Burkholderiaceae bacterium]
MGNCVSFRRSPLGAPTLDTDQAGQTVSLDRLQTENPRILERVAVTAALDQWCEEAPADALPQYQAVACDILASFDAQDATPQSIEATELDLSNYHQVLSLPLVMDKLATLQTLKLNGCHALQTLPDGLEDLPNLRDLHLPYNSGERFDQTRTRLRERHVYVTDGHDFSALPEEIQINIVQKHINVRQSGSPASQVNRQLQKLMQAHAKLTIRTPEDLTNLLKNRQLVTHVKRISVYWSSSFSDHDIQAIREAFPALESLDLFSFDRVDDAGLVDLRDMKKLTSLNLWDCNRLTDAGLARLQAPQLTSLGLYNCINLTDGGLAHLQCMDKLTSLSLESRHHNKITAAGLAHLKGLQLTSLNLSRNYCGVTDAGLAHLQGMPLTSLNLSWCSQITDAGLAHLQGMPLTSLNLYLCYDITDAGLAHLQGMPLTSLNLCGCGGITDAGLAYLQDMPLTSLNLQACHHITEARRNALREAQPNLNS